MSKQRNETAKYRNVRLKIETYNMLESYLLEMMTALRKRDLNFDEAVKALLNEHKRLSSKK